MKAVTVFEHQAVTELLSDAEKRWLDSLRGPQGERMFEVRLRETRATSFVGVLQLPNRVLQILPKMYREEATAKREATVNRLFLLSYTRKLDITEPEIARLTEQRAPLSEILYWIFAHRLWEAVRRELLRGYVAIADRRDVLKGRWLVAAQARRPDPALAGRPVTIENRSHGTLTSSPRTTCPTGCSRQRWKNSPAGPSGRTPSRHSPRREAGLRISVGQRRVEP